MQALWVFLAAASGPPVAAGVAQVRGAPHEPNPLPTMPHYAVRANIRADESTICTHGPMMEAIVHTAARVRVDAGAEAAWARAAPAYFAPHEFDWDEDTPEPVRAQHARLADYWTTMYPNVTHAFFVAHALYVSVHAEAWNYMRLDGALAHAAEEASLARFMQISTWVLGGRARPVIYNPAPAPALSRPAPWGSLEPATPVDEPCPAVGVMDTRAGPAVVALQRLDQAYRVRVFLDPRVLERRHAGAAALLRAHLPNDVAGLVLQY